MAGDPASALRAAVGQVNPEGAGGLPAGGAPAVSLRVAVGQINPTVGDLAGNVELARRAAAEAEAAGADVAVLPELAVTGYPPEDLLLKPGFVAEARAALADLAASVGSCPLVVGFVDAGDGDEPGHGDETAAGGAPAARPEGGRSGGLGGSGRPEVFNAAAVCAGGAVRGVYRKRCLPNYEVFDEQRHFRAGRDPLGLFEIAGIPVGVAVCEDAWATDGPVPDLVRGGARAVLVINGSPFRENKQAQREQIVGRLAADTGAPIVYANLVGGQDELVFDGGSFAVGPTGETLVRCESFAESVEVFDVEVPDRPRPGSPLPVTPVTPSVQASASGGRGFAAGPLSEPLDLNAQRWEALVLATRDYVRKCGFDDVALGLSGGIDSSLTAAVAAAALGPDRVHGVLMPSRYSSRHSVTDAEKVAANLGIDARVVPIEAAHRAFEEMLGGPAGPGGLTDQNLQSRIRGVVLMAVANENGWLVLTTGNKSEAAVGYSTLYGDTAGAFAVIKDVWKTAVYELARWRNRQAGREIVPETVLAKAPSAELRPDQRDDQSLPPYEVLDPILALYVEGDLTVPEICARAVAPDEVVERVCSLVDRAEYKRRQTPVGPRLTGKAFGRDRRMPIVARRRPPAR